MHGDRRALTAEILQGLGLRARTTWADATGPTESPALHRLRPPFSSGAGVKTEVELEQGYPPLDHVPALHHSRRRPVQGAALPRLLAAGEAQPPTPPNQQQWPSRQPMDLAQLATGIPASKAADTTTGATPVVPAPVDRRPSEEPVMIPISCSSFATSWYADNGTGARAGGFGRVLDYRDHRKVGRSQCQWSSYPGGALRTGARSEGSKARDGGSLLRGASDADGSDTDKGGDGGRSASPAGWQLQLRADERPYHQQHSSVYAPMIGKPMRGAADGGGGGVAGLVEFPAPESVGVRRGHQHGTPAWAAPLPVFASGDGGGGGCGRYQESGSLPATSGPLQGGSYGVWPAVSPAGQQKGAVGIDAPLPSVGAQPHTRSSSAAEAAVAITKLCLPRAWDSETRGRNGGGGTPSQQGGGGLASFELGGSRWRGVSDGGGSSAPGEYPDRSHDREIYHDGRLQRGSPLRAQRSPRSSQPQDHHLERDHQSRLHSEFPLAGTGSTVTPPRLNLGGGGGVSDAGSVSYDAASASRPPFSSVSDSARASLPGLAEADATVGGRKRGGGGTDSSAEAGAAAGRRKQRRRTSAPKKPGKPSIAKGCTEEGCDRRPIYAYKGQKKPAFCARHRLVGMIDTRHPLCKNELCTRQPSFGMEGDRRASYCAGHKQAGMINVSSRRCRQAGCLRHPNFGFPGDSRASYCSGHRETGMVDIVSRRCREPSCMRRPLYNFDGERPVCCSQHKTPGMIDVVSTRCQEPGCLCHPSFGYAHDKKARRCAKHRLENMEGVKGARQKRRRDEPTVAAATAAATPTWPSPSLPTNPNHAAAGDSAPDLAGNRDTSSITRPSARAGAAPKPSPSSGAVGGTVGAGGGAAAVGASLPDTGGTGGGRGRTGGMFDGGGGPVLATSSQK